MLTWFRCWKDLRSYLLLFKIGLITALPLILFWRVHLTGGWGRLLSFIPIAVSALTNDRVEIWPTKYTRNVSGMDAKQFVHYPHHTSQNWLPNQVCFSCESYTKRLQHEVDTQCYPGRVSCIHSVLSRSLSDWSCAHGIFPSCVLTVCRYEAVLKRHELQTVSQTANSDGQSRAQYPSSICRSENAAPAVSRRNEKSQVRHTLSARNFWNQFEVSLQIYDMLWGVVLKPYNFSSGCSCKTVCWVACFETFDFARTK